jgi:hypothetical protein
MARRDPAKEYGGAREEKKLRHPKWFFPPREQTISKNNISTQQKNNVT